MSWNNNSNDSSSSEGRISVVTLVQYIISMYPVSCAKNYELDIIDMFALLILLGIG